MAISQLQLKSFKDYSSSDAQVLETSLHSYFLLQVSWRNLGLQEIKAQKGSQIPDD